MSRCHRMSFHVIICQWMWSISMSRTFPRSCYSVSYAIKNQLVAGAFCLLLAGSLWHKAAYNRTFPCMEANYPYAIKNQRGASKEPLVGGFLRSKPLVGGFGCNELVLYGIRDTMKLSTNESRASLSLDQWEWTTLDFLVKLKIIQNIFLRSCWPGSPSWRQSRGKSCSDSWRPGRQTLLLRSVALISSLNSYSLVLSS